MKTKRWVLLTVIALTATTAAGCGDDGSVSDTGTPGDGGMGDSMVDAGDTALPDTGTPDTAMDSGMPFSCTEADLNRLLVVTTADDFSRAGLAVLSLSDLTAAVAPADLPDADSTAAQAACVGYVLSRGQGVVSVMEETNPLAVANAIPVDPAGAVGPYASNPQTVVALNENKAFVVEQARNAVTIIDPTMTGSAAVLDEIDLTPYLRAGDTDGLVDAVDAIIVGDRLFVALGNYWFDSSFAIQFEGSVLAVIDANSNNLIDIDAAVDGVQGIDLAGDNPWRGLHYDEASNSLWVAASGDSFAVDGHIESIDLTRQESSGTVLTEADLSAEINGFAVISPTRVAVLAGTDLVTVDPTVDFIVPEILSIDMDGLLLHRGTIWAWARSGEEPGLASFDAGSGMETTPAAGRFNFADLPVFDVVPVP